jgi:hypothetical protein
LTALGLSALKQRNDELLSSFAFNFNLRHYMTGQPSVLYYAEQVFIAAGYDASNSAGQGGY